MLMGIIIKLVGKIDSIVLGQQEKCILLATILIQK
jgi:hypothetical protein